jgi:RNA polymerase sigma factor (sigma-70 family)
MVVTYGSFHSVPKKITQVFVLGLLFLSGGLRMNGPPQTRPSLVVRLGNPRDGQAWSEFAEIYGPLIHRLALRLGLQDADAADIVQEVFRTVSSALERRAYDPAKGSFRGWLFTIARNLTVNFLARHRRHPRGSGDTDVARLLEEQPAPSAEDSALFEAEYRRRLLYWAAEKVRGEFSGPAWRAFWQTGVEGRPAKDVAESLGTTVGTVYYYKSRVMARLRREVERVEGHSKSGFGEDEP